MFFFRFGFQFLIHGDVSYVVKLLGLSLLNFRLLELVSIVFEALHDSVEFHSVGSSHDLSLIKLILDVDAGNTAKYYS